MRLSPTLLAAVLLLLAAPPPSVGQSSGQSPFDEEFLRSFPDDATDDSAPQLTFTLLSEISLPGPLPGDGPRLVGDSIAIPVAGSVAVTGWGSDAAPRLEAEFAWPEPAESDSPDWIEGPTGKTRYRTLPAGWLVAEKRCKRCDRGWRKKWKLRVSGSTVGPPLVTPRRIYFGAMDNRLYCVKRRNGHRLWAADVASRLSRPLVRWQVFGPGPGFARDDPRFELILAVPDDRPEVQAWQAWNGIKVATFALPGDGGRLIGVPLATPDGKIVVARQNYAPDDASLMVLQLGPPEPAAPSASGP